MKDPIVNLHDIHDLSHSFSMKSIIKQLAKLTDIHKHIITIYGFDLNSLQAFSDIYYKRYGDSNITVENIKKLFNESPHDPLVLDLSHADTEAGFTITNTGKVPIIIKDKDTETFSVDPGKSAEFPHKDRWREIAEFLWSLLEGVKEASEGNQSDQTLRHVLNILQSQRSEVSKVEGNDTIKFKGIDYE